MKYDLWALSSGHPTKNRSTPNEGLNLLATFANLQRSVNWIKSDCQAVLEKHELGEMISPTGRFE